MQSAEEASAEIWNVTRPNKAPCRRVWPLPNAYEETGKLENNRSSLTGSWFPCYWPHTTRQSVATKGM